MREGEGESESLMFKINDTHDISRSNTKEKLHVTM